MASGTAGTEATSAQEERWPTNDKPTRRNPALEEETKTKNGQSGRNTFVGLVAVLVSFSTISLSVSP